MGGLAGRGGNDRRRHRHVPGGVKLTLCHVTHTYSDHRPPDGLHPSHNAARTRSVELALAATHFERAWRLIPDRRTVLVDLGRVWQAMGRTGDATSALLAAAYGDEPRAAEMARELLPAHYPFVSEFRQAMALDPANHDLRRELGYLLLRMDRESEAEAEFRILAQNAPDD